MAVSDFLTGKGNNRALLVELLLIIGSCFSGHFEGDEETLANLQARTKEAEEHVLAAAVAESSRCHFLSCDCGLPFSSWISDIANHRPVEGFVLAPDFCDLLVYLFLDIIEINDFDLAKFLLREMNRLVEKPVLLSTIAKPDMKKVFERIPTDVYRRLFQELGKDGFLQLVAPSTQVIPVEVASKLDDFSDTFFFLNHLERPHLHLSEDAIRNAVMSITNRKELVHVLRPSLRHPMVIEREFWSHCFEVLEEEDFPTVAKCFIANASSVAEAAAALVTDESVYSGKTCKFLQAVLSDTCDRLDFLFSPRIAKVMQNLTSQPLLDFWNLFTCAPPFQRLRGITEWKYPFAFHGLIYMLMKTRKIENEDFVSKLVVPELDEDDLNDLAKFIPAKKNKLEKLFQPFTSRERVVRFLAIAQHFGIHCPVTRNNRAAGMFLSGPVQRQNEEATVYEGLTTENILPFLVLAIEMRVNYYTNPYDGFDSFSQLHKSIMTIFDKFIMEIPTPLSEFHQLCLIHLYDTFILSRKLRSDVIQNFNPIRSEQHVVVKVSRQLWEIDALSSNPVLRDRFVETLAMFCDQSSQYAGGWTLGQNRESHFLSSMGRAIIPFIISTGAYKNTISKYNLSQFRTALHGSASLFSEYIQNAPLLQAIDFLDNYAINRPLFSLDIEDQIVDLFKELKEKGDTDGCIKVAHFMHDCDSLGSLGLSDEELLEYVIAEIKSDQSEERMQLSSFVSLFLKEETTSKARIYAAIQAFRNLYFNETQDIHDGLFYGLATNAREFASILQMMYARSPDDPDVAVIKVVPDPPIEPGRKSIMLVDAVLKALCEEPSVQIFFWTKNLIARYRFLFADLEPERLYRIFDVAFSCLDDVEKLQGQKRRDMKSFRITTAAGSFMHTFLSIPRNLDYFFKYIFRDFGSLGLSQLSFCLDMLDTQFSDLETDLISACVLTKFKFATYIPQIIMRLEPHKHMSHYLASQLSVVANCYFQEITDASSDHLRAVQKFVDSTDTPYYDFLERSNTFSRDGRYTPFSFFGFSPVPSEFQFTRQLERDFFQQFNTFADFHRGHCHLEVPPEEENLEALPKEINREIYESLDKRQRAEAFQAILPTLPAKLNAEQYLYVLAQPYWIRNMIFVSPSGLLNASNYTKLLEVYNHILSLQEIVTDFRASDEILREVLCNKELYKTMIPIIGNKEWRNKLTENEAPGRVMFVPSIAQVFKQNRALTLFLEAALKYKPAVDVFITAFKELLDSSTLEKLLPSVAFLAERVTDSRPFEDFICKDILPCCLQPAFRANRKLMSRLATVMIKYSHEDDRAHFAQQMVQLMIFFFIDGSDKCFEGALKIGDGLTDEDRKNVAPFVQHFFDMYVKQNTPDGNVHWMKICRIFKFLISDVENNLTDTLDSLLTNYRPSKIAQIGALLGILGPKRNDSPLPGSLVRRLPQPPLNISPTLYAEAPAFWNIIAKHQTRLTDITRTHPELVDSTLSFVIKFPILLDVMLKISLFQHMIRREPSTTTFSGRDVLMLSINRVSIVAESVKSLADISPERLFENIHVQFKGEEGVDAGGVARDWFGCLSTELFGLSTNLFVPTANGRSLQVNKDSGTTPDVLRLFKFAGRFMAMAMAHNVAISAHLTSSLYKYLIGAPLSLRDMEQIDENVARSLQKILDEPVDGLMLDFTVGTQEKGHPISVELKPGGADITVTEENKLEYVELCLNYYFRTYASVQISSFLEGFFEVIPQQKLEMFTADELDLVICGIPEIDIEDLQKNCRIVEPYNRKHPVIQTFFNVLRSWKSDDLVRLLQFVTGSSQVPAGGFATLTDQGRPFSIAPGGDEDRLPVAHVCSNQLDLPPYSTEELMNEKLLCAVRNCSGFGKA